MQNFTHIFIIDDEPITNMISTRLIGIYLPDSIVETFTDAEIAFATIKEYAPADKHPIVVLLDINMPGIDGWEFLDLFNGLSGDIRKLYNVYILSSSIDHGDREKARMYPDVKGVLFKPLNAESIQLFSGG